MIDETYNILTIINLVKKLFHEVKMEDSLFIKKMENWENEAKIRLSGRYGTDWTYTDIYDGIMKEMMKMIILLRDKLELSSEYANMVWFLMQKREQRPSFSEIWNIRR